MPAPLIAILLDHFDGNSVQLALPEECFQLFEIGAMTSHGVLGEASEMGFLLATGGKKPASYLVRLISRGTPADAGSVSSPWFSALPANERAMASVFWVQPKFALTIASQLENLPVSAADVGQFASFCDKPVAILSARTAPERRRMEHASMAGRLAFGEHVLAEISNHWIMQEEPDLVVRAIEKIAKYSENLIAHPS